MPGSFIDSNILLHLASNDPAKADKTEQMIAADGPIIVQVLNEIANVVRRQMQMSWPETHTFLDTLQRLLTVHPITLETFQTGLELAQRYRLSTHDSMIAAAALTAAREKLLSEDMQDGLRINGQRRLTNPFRTPG
jgi:predicted nucleic acid-binding protein